MKNVSLKNHRDFIKDDLRLQINFQQTDQNQGIAPPPVQKPLAPNQKKIPLPDHDSFADFSGTDLIDAMTNRQSHRNFKSIALTQAELGFLLWTTQGVRSELQPGFALRTVPSAGCRHAFETYLLVSEVEGLFPGIYRYLPLDHALVLESAPDRLAERLSQATLNQNFIASAPVCFVWTAIPYRMEWRYGLAAHRVILMDAGHLCQNLYLACEAIGAGTCAIAAYHQPLIDQLLEVDGEEEFTLYLAPVGKV